MAGNQNSGGPRPTAPQNNPANINPLGGNGQSGQATQPAKYIPGLPYGQGQATMAQQQAAPMAGSTPASAPEPTLPPLTPLSAPTERPNEPLTHGMDFGPGAGSEILGIPVERPLSETLAAMLPYDTTGDVQELYDLARSRGL